MAPRPNLQYVHTRTRGGSLTRPPQCYQSRRVFLPRGLLEGEYRSELRPPVGRCATWHTGDLSGANAFGIRKSEALVFALFKAELDPGIHLVEYGHALQRVLDGTAACGCADALGQLEVIGISRIDTVFDVRLPARIPALGVGMEPA